MSEGNRRLGAIVALAVRKSPQLEILEVEARTGSATQEILTRLRGDTIHRMCSKYVFAKSYRSSGVRRKGSAISMQSLIPPSTWRRRRPLADSKLHTMS